jgi:hypothetical protein
MAVTLKILHEAKGKGCRAYGVPLSLSKVQRGGKRLCSELQEFFKQPHIGVPSNLQTKIWQHKMAKAVSLLQLIIVITCFTMKNVIT